MMYRTRLHPFAPFFFPANEKNNESNTALSMSNASVHLYLRTFSALVRDYEDEQNDKTADALLTHLNVRFKKI